MAVNAILTASKFAAGILGHSHALIADAVESTADIFSSIIVWRRLVVAAEPAIREHPYGHGKAEPLAAASVAVMLLLAAFGIMVPSAAGLFEPREEPQAFTLYILIAVIVIKEFLFRFVSREAGVVAQHRAFDRRLASPQRRHHFAGRRLGISLALFGGPRLAFADDAAAIVAGAIIAWNGWRLLRPALDELMDAAPGSDLVSDIRNAAAARPGRQRRGKVHRAQDGFSIFC